MLCWIDFPFHIILLKLTQICFHKKNNNFTIQIKKSMKTTTQLPNSLTKGLYYVTIKQGEVSNTKKIAIQ